LWEGALALEVDPLGPGERFVVEVGDGEVEVRGTKFAVVARADRLVRVDVTRGRVEVRPRGAALVVLEAGQSWTAPAEPVRQNVPVAQTLPRSEPELRTPVQRVASRPSMAIERAAHPRGAQQEAQYDDAWDALRAHDYKKAAEIFGRLLKESPGAPLADEAAFWRATALARGDDSQGALAAFRQMLDAYPQSPRRGEASTIVGWLLVAAHEPTEAEARFRAAIDDPHEDVRASAREGLETLTPRSAR
jgi:TolA-binding protein